MHASRAAKTGTLGYKPTCNSESGPDLGPLLADLLTSQEGLASTKQRVWGQPAHLLATNWVPAWLARAMRSTERGRAGGRV